MNRQIVLKSRPIGMPGPANFEMKEVAVPSIKDGELLVRAKLISVDPYMRGRMSDVKSYAAPFEVGMPIYGGVVAEVEKSLDPSFKPGDAVLGNLPWQEIQAVLPGTVTRVDKTSVPLGYYLGILGMPGLTAYFGLLDIGKPVSGETVVVSGAAGAVGMVVGQLARLKGCRVLGIAGTDEKVSYLKNTLRFDEAINYKNTKRMREAIGQACPGGVDIYFDNVGGEISDAVLTQINKGARIIICGQISLYNNTVLPVGPRPQSYLLRNSAMMQGFIVSNYSARFGEGIHDISKWLGEGKLMYEQTVIKGFEKLPEALIGLFHGNNIGKCMVDIG